LDSQEFRSKAAAQTRDPARAGPPAHTAQRMLTPLFLTPSPPLPSPPPSVTLLPPQQREREREQSGASKSWGAFAPAPISPCWWIRSPFSSSVPRVGLGWIWLRGEVWLGVGEESSLARSGGGVVTTSPLGFLLVLRPPRWAVSCH